MTLAQDVKPAGGAELGEVVTASALGAGLAAALLLVVYLHRSGRTQVVQRVAERLGGAMGVPAWVALPVVFTTLSLLTALFGMYWDIALHIGRGRDSGPLANPAHYFILFGLFGIFAGGVLAASLPRGGERPGPASVRITEGWYAPVGGLLLAGAGAYSLLGFPLDDVWHRLFGQDVTLWGPTHLMLIGGAGLSLVGMLVLEKEGGAGGQVIGHVREYVRRSFAMGGLLIGLSVFQGEFDFGVPQFRLVLEPMMIAAAAGVALVAARLWTGPGGAVAAASFFLVVHSVISVLVGPVLGEITPRFPLYVGSAVLVELVALVLVRRPVLFGAVAGAVVGTLGSLTEALWSQAFMPLGWGSDVLLEGGLMALVSGTAGGVVGALLALGLTGRLHDVPRSRLLYAAALTAVAAMAANGLLATVPDRAEVQVALSEAGTRDGVRHVDAAVRLPDGLVDDPSWVQVTAWQGGGRVIAPLEQGDDGTWRTTRPFPASGDDWKTVLRVHDGRTLTALPVWLPADEAIDAPEVPAPATFTRTLGPEIDLLQRERDLDVPGWLFGAASLVVLVCSLVLLVALAWGVERVSGRRPRDPSPESRPSPVLSPQPAR